MDLHGAFLNGCWVSGKGAILRSFNPARDFSIVSSGPGASCEQVDEAVAAAAEAFPAWAATPYSERLERCLAIGSILEDWKEDLAQIMSAEMGKPIREARGEAGSLLGKVKVSALAQERLPNLALPNAPGTSHWRPHGPMGIVGPFNYPIHLIHTHLMPALLAGNTVVFKPSEVTPGTGEMYGRLLEALDLPPGVVNLVQGGGDIGAHLSAHPTLKGLCFTGSWATGRRILEATLDQPWKMVALEMGGRNAAIVLEDADLAQAIHEVVIGACLTAGQRCTATSRVLVHKDLEERFVAGLVAAFSEIAPGDPLLDETLMGPLATQKSFETFMSKMAWLETTSVETLVSSTAPGGGAFVTPSIHRRTTDDADWQTYLGTELFGPNIALETIEDETDALERVRQSPYGLSLSVFCQSPERFERFCQEAPSGIFNWNRSTNNASGLLPFGGLGRSGNFKPAGASSALYCAHPVAVLKREHGVVDWDPRFGPIVQSVLGKGEAS